MDIVAKITGHSKRKNFIINKHFQDRFSFFVVSWLFVLSLVFPFTIYQLFDFFLSLMQSQMMGAPYEIIKQTKGQIIYVLIGSEIVLVFLVFLMSIFVSHKIAGPIYRLRKFLDEISGGVFTKKVNFRKGDYFLELADDMNVFCSKILDLKKKDHDLIEKNIIPNLESAHRNLSGEPKKQIEDALNALKELRERYKI